MKKILNAFGKVLAPVLDHKGNQVELTDRELKIAHFNERHANALGFEVPITTMTTIVKSVTEQKFYEIPPGDFVDIRTGNGAWMTNLVTYRSFQLGDSFASGLIDTGGNDGRLAAVNTGIDAITVQIRNWAKQIGWTLFEVEQAAKSGNWDLITQLEVSRKTNWDLGIQELMFLGLSNDTTVLGLYTQSGVTVNTDFMSGPIKNMASVDLNYFCANILGLYRANCSGTAMPNMFVIPESDYLGLAAPSSPDFPIKSKLALLEETFKIMTKNPNFRVDCTRYGDTSFSGQTYQQYILYNKNERSLRADLPVDYTATIANSINGFSFQNVGYGQFTGVQAYRPAEMLYFRFTP